RHAADGKCAGRRTNEWRVRAGHGRGLLVKFNGTSYALVSVLTSRSIVSRRSALRSRAIKGGSCLAPSVAAAGDGVIALWLGRTGPIRGIFLPACHVFRAAVACLARAT